MNEDNLKIDPNEFAMNIISHSVRDLNLTNQRFIKHQLTLYLEAYYLIKDFNQLEINQLESMKQKQISDLFDKMLSGRFQP